MDEPTTPDEAMIYIVDNFEKFFEEENGPHDWANGYKFDTAYVRKQEWYKDIGLNEFIRGWSRIANYFGFEINIVENEDTTSMVLFTDNKKETFVLDGLYDREISERIQKFNK